MSKPNTTLIACLVFFLLLAGLAQAQYPSRWDWREHGGVTPVRNQGGCGSCWAFATVATMESAIRIHSGASTNLSEEHLVRCSDYWGCSGGWEAFQYYLNIQDHCSKIGTVKESCYGYTGTDGSCGGCGCSRIHELLDWGRLPNASHYSRASKADMKEEIYNRGPIFAALSVGGWCLLNPTTGNPTSQCGGSGSVNHAIVIVGWDDNFKGSGNGCWIIKNSWGTWWQDGGYGYVKYGTGRIGTGACWVDYNGGGGLDCDNAVDLTRNVPYDGTTQGSASRVDAYDCDDWDESGPEKVHRIITTSPGDITATLSNLDGIDLDVFILDACNADSCVAHGDTAATYADAPAGTYFVVVDGHGGDSGSYTLTVSAGLDCANVVGLTPNVPYTGSTQGPSMVDSYTGGGSSYEDETGPEKVHCITAFMNGGDITATLGPHAPDLELFIIRPCDPGSCLAHAFGPGAITATYANAPAGTYYIVVDGYNGASGPYTLTADALPGPRKAYLPWSGLLFP